VTDGLADRLDALVAGSFLARAEHHDALGSTNDRAAELGRDGGPLPALVAAARQQSGRGRGGNRWWSSDGALTFSIVFDRDALGLAPERLPLVALATGLAVRAAVDETLSAAARPPDAAVPLVKWPNDVLVGDRKIAGILVEESGGRVVVGIGLNVNNDFATAPADVEARATSIRSLLGRSVERAAVLSRLLEALADELGRLAEPTDDLARRWSNDCALTGRAVRIRVHDRIVEGVCDGIDPSGALLVRNENATERVLSGVVESYG
jgi:BirA family biotin operon repressor/biotin-[acetyl-CoA-carboxylase] ligase